MSIAYESCLDLLGNTPLIRLQHCFPTVGLIPAAGSRIYGKMENRNPGGSVKDRIALSMIEDAEKKGLLKEGSTLIEPTSGNTGIGLAWIGKLKGYKVILCMPESMSVERRKLLKKFGAELVLTPASQGMKGAISRAEEIATEHTKSFIPQQFNNPSNPAVHKATTAQEIWKDTDGNIDVFIAGVGTGGTISGVGEELKKKNPNIKVIAVEPADSPVISGGQPGPHKIQGIGAGFIPGNLNTEIIDDVVKVTNDDAIQTSHKAAIEEGLLVGYSSGAALFAALEVAKRDEYKGKRIVVVLPDTGERYLSSFEI